MAWQEWESWQEAWREENGNRWNELGIDDSEHETSASYVLYNAYFNDQVQKLDEAMTQNITKESFEVSRGLAKSEPCMVGEHEAYITYDTENPYLGDSPYTQEDFQILVWYDEPADLIFSLHCCCLRPDAQQLLAFAESVAPVE